MVDDGRTRFCAVSVIKYCTNCGCDAPVEERGSQRLTHIIEDNVYPAAAGTITSCWSMLLVSVRKPTYHYLRLECRQRHSLPRAE